jgi:hypothetical protein
VAYDLTTLLTDFYARGFDFMNDGSTATARATRFINQAIHEIDGAYDWPYTLTSTTGTAPLTISDLRKVQTVQDQTNNNFYLLPDTAQVLKDAYGDLSYAGTPQIFYFTGQTTISVYPASTSATLLVTYWKVGADLSSGLDTPLMPDRWRSIIVDLAAAKAFRESNVPDEANLALQEYQRKLQLMAGELLDPQGAANQHIKQTYARNF